MAEVPRVVVLFGGRSEIGLEVVRRLVSVGTVRVVLAARRAGELEAEVAELSRAGASVDTVEFDADDLAGQARTLDHIAALHPRIDLAVLAFGILGDQPRAEVDPDHVRAILHTDFVAQAHLLTLLAERMRAARHGTLVVFSSIAGARVRRANYVYGSAKAGLDGFASGLSDTLHGSGVRLLLIRPGFVVGRMTEGMSPAPFPSTPDQVGAAVVDALRTGRGEVWVPGVLSAVVAAFRVVPRPVWRRLSR